MERIEDITNKTGIDFNGELQLHFKCVCGNYLKVITREQIKCVCGRKYWTVTRLYRENRDRDLV